MSLDIFRERRQAHEYLDQLPPAQLSAVRSLLESMLPDPVSLALASAPIEDEEISEDEIQTVTRSREWFKHNAGFSLEEVASELGFTMDQIRHGKE